jgi:SNF2 family DNA or RNA helicase
MDVNDPFEWDIQRVKEDICSRMRLPGWDNASLDALGTLFEERGITGQILLTKVGMEQLDGLGIISLDDRNEIIRRISYLQGKSDGYKAQNVNSTPMGTAGAVPACPDPETGTTTNPTDCHSGRKRIAPTTVTMDSGEHLKVSRHIFGQGGPEGISAGSRPTGDYIDPNDPADKDYLYLLDKYPPNSGSVLKPVECFLFYQPKNQPEEAGDISDGEIGSGDAKELAEILNDNHIQREIRELKKRNHKTSHMSFITKQEIIKEMDQHAAEFVAALETRKENRVKDAALWTLARSQNSAWQETEIARHNSSAKRASEMLQQLRNAILTQSYTQASDVRSQCTSLEGQLELSWNAKRFITILESECQPDISSTYTEPVRRPPQPPELASDEEELYSDSSWDVAAEETGDRWDSSTESESASLHGPTDASREQAVAGTGVASDSDVVLSHTDRRALRQKVLNNAIDRAQQPTPNDTDDLRNGQTPPQLFPGEHAAGSMGINTNDFYPNSPPTLPNASIGSIRKRTFPQDDSEDADLEPSDNERSDDEKPSSRYTQYKKALWKRRKRAVPQNQEALLQQQNDQVRIQAEERRKAAMAISKATTGLTNSDDAAHPVTFVDPIVYLHPNIGQRVKKIQEDGIQFLWREIVGDPKQQGCLLAHTMGLGKTMQVISLLVTIAQVANSAEPQFRNLVPETLRESRRLVVCPTSVVDNWVEEFKKWTPQDVYLGKIRKITSAQASRQRTNEIKSWADEGGVLILGYGMLRGWVQEHETLKQLLLNSANLVIADEAHTIKNPNTKIAQIFKLFRTGSRIALTGSPLSNNVLEYYYLMDWVVPGYLGNLTDFQAEYAWPIQLSQFLESSTEEKQEGQRKLKDLKSYLTAKVHLAGIDKIKVYIPRKVEYDVALSLTTLQKGAYDAYVGTVHQDHNIQKTQNAVFFAWFGELTLLLNHPTLLLQKMGEQNDENDDVAEAAEEVTAPASAAEPENIYLATDAGVRVSSGLLDTALKPYRLLERCGELECPTESYRTQITQEIIKKSVMIGDKVLIFSQTLPSLYYLEQMLEGMGYEFARIYGATPVKSRQTITERFNTATNCHVMLISTTAGGLGLNLQGANRVIIFDFGFNPSWTEQAIGRAYRIGQKKTVYVYRFRAAGTFQDASHNTSIYKQQLSSNVLGTQNYEARATKDLRHYLRKVQNVPKDSLEGVIGKDPHVLDAILKLRKHRDGIVNVGTRVEDQGDQVGSRAAKPTNSLQKTDGSELLPIDISD